MNNAFDFQALFTKGLPAPTPAFSGFPAYNFVGGHGDPESIPVEDLIASAERVLRRRGKTLATYNLDGGPLGDGELRGFLADKLAQYRGFQPSTDEILITSGSHHALTLLFHALLEPGDAAVCEE